MAKKFIFNVLLNVVLIAMVFTIVSAFKKDQYLLAAAAFALLLIVSYFKIRLLKQVREITKNQSEK